MESLTYSIKSIHYFMFYSRKARAARIPEQLQELRAAQGGDCRGRQPATSEGWSPGPDGDEWRHSHLLTQIVTLFVLCVISPALRTPGPC